MSTSTPMVLCVTARKILRKIYIFTVVTELLPVLLKLMILDVKRVFLDPQLTIDTPKNVLELKIDDAVTIQIIAIQLHIKTSPKCYTNILTTYKFV